MPSYGQLTSAYTKLLSAIENAGGVPCEDYPQLFYPEDIPAADTRRVAVKLAKQLCKECPIQMKCFEYALETNQRHGIWGGTEPSDRI